MFGVEDFWEMRGFRAVMLFMAWGLILQTGRTRTLMDSDFFVMG